MELLDPTGSVARAVKPLASRPHGLAGRPPETRVPIAARWQDVMVIVAGGAGKHSAFIPTFGRTRSVTRPIGE